MTNRPSGLLTLRVVCTNDGDDDGDNDDDSDDDGDNDDEDGDDDRPGKSTQIWVLFPRWSVFIVFC